MNLTGEDIQPLTTDTWLFYHTIDMLVNTYATYAYCNLFWEPSRLHIWKMKPDFTVCRLSLKHTCW